MTGFTSRNDFPVRNALQASNGGGPVLQSRDGRSWTPAADVSANAVAEVSWSAGSMPMTFAASDRGVFRSRDGGASWTGGGCVPGCSATAVSADPVTTGIVYAAVRGVGIFKSLDGGATWLLMREGLVSPFLGIPDVTAIVVSRPAPSTVYLGSNRGVYRSDTGGSIWERVGLGAGIEPGALAVDPRDPSIVYAGYFPAGVVKSVDGGRTWSQTGTLPALASAGVRPPIPRDILIDPADPSSVYVSVSGGVVVSRNSGASWAPATEGLPTLSTYRIAIDPLTPGVIYAAGDGFYRSTDRGAHWEAMHARLPMTGRITVRGTAVLVARSPGTDGFVTAVAARGEVLWSTYVGGFWEDRILDAALDHAGYIHVTGSTGSASWPLANAGPRPFGGGSDALGGGNDAFWARLPLRR